MIVPTLLPWISKEQAKLIRTRGFLWSNYLSATAEGVPVPDEPCVSCTIVQCCGTPQLAQTIYELTASLRQAWEHVATDYDTSHRDFPLRAVDWTLVLAMFIAGELARIPKSVLSRDCADKAEYFCRYVRLIQAQSAQELADKQRSDALKSHVPEV